MNNLYLTFKSIFFKNVYDLLKIKLQNISTKYNIDYDELEELYLKDIKDNIN